MQQVVEPQEVVVREVPVDVARAPSRRRRPDLWVPIVALVALATYLPHGFQGLFSRDLGVYAYGARQVLAGEPPYVGIVNRAGPLAHLLPVPGILLSRVSGLDEITGMRVWYLVLAVASVVLSYVVGRHVFRSTPAGLAAAATLLAFQGFIDLATTGPREKTPMVLFVLCAFWALSHRRWVLTGVAIALATLTLQIVFLPLLLAAVVTVLVDAHVRRLRSLGRLLVGGAIPTLAVTAYFAAYGALGALVDGLYLWNSRYSTGRPFTSRASLLWGRLEDGYGASLWLLVGGLVLVFVVTLLRLADWTRRHDAATVTMIALSVATVGSLLWTEVDFDGFQDAFPLLPLAALGVGAAIAEVGHRVPRPVALVAAALAVVVPTGLAVHYSTTVRDNRLQVQEAMTDVLLKDLPGARIWSVSAPQFLVLAQRSNPTSYQLLSDGQTDLIDDAWPGGLDGWVQWNLAQQPDLVAVNGLELKLGDWKSRLGPGYVQVGSAPGVFWFARASYGPETLQAIRVEGRAVRAAMSP